MSPRGCEIVWVQQRDGFRWRWRHTDTSGAVHASNKEFELFYECVTAARSAGYEPLFAGRRIVCAAKPRTS